MSEPDTLDTVAIRANFDLFGPGHPVVKDLCDEIDRLRAVVAEHNANLITGGGASARVCPESCCERDYA